MRLRRLPSKHDDLSSCFDLLMMLLEEDGLMINLNLLIKVQNNCTRSRLCGKGYMARPSFLIIIIRAHLNTKVHKPQVIPETVKGLSH